MLKNIMEAMKDRAMESFEKRTDVPNENSAEAAEATGETIFETLKDGVLTGDFSNIKDALAGGQGLEALKERPLIKKMMEKASARLQEKGIDKETADRAAETTVPEAMEQVAEKYSSEKEEDSAFDIQDLIKGIASDSGRDDLLDKAKDMLGNLGGIGGALGNIFGKK